MGKPTRKHYVLFMSPGTMFSETRQKAIDSWDIPKAVELSKGVEERYGAKPYGFKFETYLEAEPVVDGEGGTMNVQPKLVESSDTHFLGGVVSSFDEVQRRNDPKENILRTNMSCNDLAFICVNTNSFKSTMPFEEGDCVADENGVVTERGDSPERVKYREEFRAAQERRREEDLKRWKEKARCESASGT